MIEHSRTIWRKGRFQSLRAAEPDVSGAWSEVGEGVKLILQPAVRLEYLEKLVEGTRNK